jgi:hypothetical protein
MPCRAATGLGCLSRLIHTVWPCRIHTCHAMAMPFFSRIRHSTAIERRPVGYLPALGFFRLPHGVPLILLSRAYQPSLQRSIPAIVKSGSSTLQKEDLLHSWTSRSDISGHHADFHKGHGTVGAGQGHGMAGTRHAVCESIYILPL